MRQTLPKLTALLAATALSLPAMADHGGKRFYIEGGVGSAEPSDDENELERRLAARGHTAVADVEEDSTAYTLRAGVKLSQYFGVELGYADLGDVESQVTATNSSNPNGFVVDLLNNQPFLVQAVNLSGVFSIPIEDSGFSLDLKLGFAYWDGEVEFAGNGFRATREDDGVDAVFGAAARYDFRSVPIGLGVEFSQYELDEGMKNRALFGNLRYRF